MNAIKQTAAICVSAMMLGCAFSGAALAQGMAMKKMPAAKAAPEAIQKVIAENDKLQVIDVVQHPGDVGAMQSRLGLVVHWITGGKVERTYADGSKEIVERKAGETALITEKRPYAVKNVGKTTTHLIEVKLK